jgi:hypothetical protein
MSSYRNVRRRVSEPPVSKDVTTDTPHDQRLANNATTPNVEKDEPRRDAMESTCGDSIQDINTDVVVIDTSITPNTSTIDATFAATVTPPLIPPYVFDMVSPNNRIPPDVLTLWDDVGKGIDNDQCGKIFVSVGVTVLSFDAIQKRSFSIRPYILL